MPLGAVHPIFEVAAEANIALIVQVKDNQPTLNQKLQQIAAATAPIDAVGSRTRGRNRDERRIVTVFDPAEEFATTEWHPHIAAIVRVERKVFTRIVLSGLWHWSTETAFHVSNTKLAAVDAADAIRGHWKIETTSHYSRDVTFGEDKSRIRTNPGVFARLRSFAFNILKSNKTSTTSQDRYRAALAGIDNLLEDLAIP
jgi:predicted transposase YbfD/YdcC